ncbi:MAG: CPBP family intramembrane glutamic endopeptidase [Acidimicrobiales bacterium]
MNESRSAADRSTAAGGLLKQPAMVLALLALQFVVMGGGLALFDVDYNSSTDLARMWLPLSLTAIVFIVATTRLQDPAEIGLQRPRPRSYWWIALLLATLTLIPLVRMVNAISALPEDQSISGGLVVKTLLAVAIVGFTEEWMFRGLLLTFLSRRFGLRNGVIISTVGFGLFHAVNVFGGHSASDTAGQVAATTLLGLVFAMSGLGIRSIVPLMVIHAVYDFFIVTSEQLIELGSNPSSAAIENVLTFVGLATMVAAAVLLFRTPSGDEEPYLTS